MMERLREEALLLMAKQHFDALGLATVDFKEGRVQAFALRDNIPSEDAQTLSFDLASITKAMTLSSSYFLSPDLFTEEMVLLLEHRGGLPAWARLPRGQWREFVSSFPLSPSPTEYSDLSALRLQVELEQRAQRPLYDLCSSLWHKDVHHWRESPGDKIYPTTGLRGGRPLCGEVNDDNAFFVGEKMAHAGLFATAQALGLSLVNFNERLDLLAKMEAAFRARDKESRFLYGFDTERDPAGPGCSPHTFGHLGFTGTSFWVDAQRAKGLVVLSNACYPFCHRREDLGILRRRMGKIFWCPP